MKLIVEKTTAAQLTAAKVRSMLFVTSLIICPFLASETGIAQSATATLRSGGLSTIAITQNQTFQLNFSLTTNFISSGATYFLVASNNGSGFFRITARDVSSSPYPFPITGDATAFTIPAGDLNPVNDFDLGATSGAQVVPAGVYNIGTLSITALNVPPGQYTISLDHRSIVTDRTGGGFQDVPISGGLLTISVLKISSITSPANDHIILQCFGVPNQVNKLEVSADLSPGSFAPILPAPPAADGTGAFTYDDAGAVDLTKRFYRLSFP